MSTMTTETVTYVDPYPGRDNDEQIEFTCGKCLGTGTVNWGNVTLNRRVNGQSVNARWCFDCHGLGKIVRTVKSLRDAERRAVRAANKRIAEAAAATAERDEWAAAHVDLAARLAAISEETFSQRSGMSDAEMYRAMDAEKAYGDFIVSIAHQSVMRPLSEKQAEAVAAALVKYDERVVADAAKAQAQRYFGEEKQKVTATGVVAVSINVDGYAYNSTDRMVIIEGTGDFEGVTFKTTGKGETLFATERGDVVEFTATIKGHREYNGTPQTVITRAKITVLSEEG